MCTFLRANSQRNKMTNFSYHQMPFLSIKALLLVSLRLRSTCRKTPRAEKASDWVLPQGLLSEGLRREKKGRWDCAEGCSHLRLRDLGHLSQPPWPPLRIRNLPQRVLVRNKRVHLCEGLGHQLLPHYMVNTEESFWTHHNSPHLTDVSSSAHGVPGLYMHHFFIFVTTLQEGGWKARYFGKL